MSQKKLSTIQLPRLGRGKFFALFLIMLIAQVVDLTIGTLPDVFRDFAVSFWGTVLFVAIGAIYIVGQYFFLSTVKAKNQQEGRRKARIKLIENSVTATQYVLTAIMVSIILQVIFASQYYTGLLAVGSTISYGLAAVLMGLLAYWLLSWFRINKAPVVLLYGLAAAMIAVNAAATIVYFDIVLLEDKPAVTTPASAVLFSDVSDPGKPIFFVSALQSITLNGYFILTWAGTILLLRHNIQRIGRIKFWVLVTAPMLFFMSFYIMFYESIQVATPPSEEESILVPMLIIIFSAMAAFILFGIAFRSVAGSISQGRVRDYMMITSYGFVLFFTAAAATISGAGYPPFGIANVLLVGPFALLILVGLYRSAVSVAQDAKLRHSIKVSAGTELKLLDSIGTAEMQRELEKKVMTTTKMSAAMLAQQSGVEPSLTDEEIKDLVSHAAKEIREKKLERKDGTKTSLT